MILNEGLCCGLFGCCYDKFGECFVDNFFVLIEFSLIEDWGNKLWFVVGVGCFFVGVN